MIVYRSTRAIAGPRRLRGNYTVPLLAFLRQPFLAGFLVCILCKPATFEFNGILGAELWVVLLAMLFHSLDPQVGGIDAEHFGTKPVDKHELRTTESGGVHSLENDTLLGAVHREKNQLVHVIGVYGFGGGRIAPRSMPWTCSSGGGVSNAGSGRGVVVGVVLESILP